MEKIFTIKHNLNKSDVEPDNLLLYCVVKSHDIYIDIYQ